MSYWTNRPELNLDRWVNQMLEAELNRAWRAQCEAERRYARQHPLVISAYLAHPDCYEWWKRRPDRKAPPPPAPAPPPPVQVQPEQLSLF